LAVQDVLKCIVNEDLASGSFLCQKLVACLWLTGTEESDIVEYWHANLLDHVPSNVIGEQQWEEK
jgi:hypothetical protein